MNLVGLEGLEPGTLGPLQTGLSADILIVEGNPAKDISDTRNVKHVFLRGKQVDRDSLKLKK